MRAFLLFTLLTVAPVALAQSRCSWDRLDHIQMNECLGREFAETDAELNRVYQQVLRAVATHDDWTTAQRRNFANELRQAQRLWIRYKEAACQNAADFMYPGNGGGVAQGFCTIEVTRERTRQLRNFL